MPLLFSYGTLQEAATQRATFGRLLPGDEDYLPGYEPTRLRVDDPEFIAATGRALHTNLVRTGRADSRLRGTALEVTETELIAADGYEHPSRYRRTQVRLASGREAWIYSYVPGTPDAEHVDKVAWVRLEQRRILSTRSSGKDTWYLPGGKREAGESDEVCLVREIAEELAVKIEIASARRLGVFEAQAHGKPPGALIRMSCYTADFTGTLAASSEIAEFAWLSHADRERSSPVDQVIFDWLHERGELA
jgi:ADP-ribose pyrophosphatase YjhB (NUDIX family)